ncbi:hypothetical protein AB0I28_37470 [Phytomonospora sp. NPDC050363]|uniref:hypothetical protein n=1 Tax=Phytomonospora sp. NPDC050363 TaxID=3155642 RepID=UPI0033CCE4D6
MASKAIRVEVSRELAELLIRDGVATEPEGRRSSGWALVIDVLTPVTMVISLLQAPQTLADVATRVSLLLNRPARSSGGQGVQIDAIGPGGQLRGTFPSGATVAEITELLAKTVFPPSDDGSP